MFGNMVHHRLPPEQSAAFAIQYPDVLSPQDAQVLAQKIFIAFHVIAGKPDYPIWSKFTQAINRNKNYNDYYDALWVEKTRILLNQFQQNIAADHLKVEANGVMAKNKQYQFIWPITKPYVHKERASLSVFCLSKKLMGLHNGPTTEEQANIFINHVIPLLWKSQGKWAKHGRRHELEQY
jgi:hypothetical protein